MPFMKILMHRFTYLLLIVTAFLGMVSCDYENPAGDHANHYLLFPNNGETLVRGKTYRIAWTDDLSISMRIRLLKSNKIHLKISENAPNTGEFVWTIPDTLEGGLEYSVRVLSNDDDFTYYESEKSFRILKESDTASFADPRDGQVYRTVRLSGRWWMAQNFNYDTLGSYCYGSDYKNCETYGRLYTITTAKNASPPGWHLPTDDEWRTLEAYLGIPNKEINTIGFRGVNAGYLLRKEEGVGFNAKYSGYAYSRYYLRYYSISQSAYFWTSSNDPGDSKYWIRQLTSTSGGIERSKISAASYAFSVRYIQDL
jgi:uncharacterized protein (TIGR02145 family)